MTGRQKKNLIRIIVSFVILAGEMIFFKVTGLDLGRWELVCYLVPYLIIGWDILRKALLGIIHLQVFDECFLMTIATVGAFATGEYSEGTAVMLFYQVGELFQSYAVSKSRRSIAGLMDIRPDYANIENDRGELVTVDPEEVEIGGIITVKPGEKIPLDGVVVSGVSSADTSALTGEPVPRDIGEGSEVISGCINLTGNIRVRVTKEFGQSTVSKILELVENSQEKKSKSENFITKFARVYTPAVVIAAVLLAVVPPIVLGQPFGGWIYRAMTFLVISCPCALVISIPLSFFGGIGGASRSGILIKGGNYLEALSSAGVMVFDKTGTLTKGSFEVTAVHSGGSSENELLETACLAECYSNHPISLSLKRAWGKKCDTSSVEEVSEIPGQGVSAVIGGKKVLCGNMKLMKSENIDGAHECHRAGTAVHVAVDGVYKGHIIISDSLKDGAKETVSGVKEMGVKKTVMLTGDDKRVGAHCAEELGIDEYHAQLLPADKVDCLERLLAEKSEKESLVFVGDGVNDAPVLTRADIGIAMGGIGSDAAIEAADIVLMDDDPLKIITAMKISRKTMRIVKENIVFALAVKAAVLLLGALGFANMWAAVFADVGVSVIAILNAMRCASAGKKESV
ncbi:MAG: cadmium-translocating P-type ATPase [Ruminococcus sp.]|nr:cadmium-translocating P-type ATPase [Ruminococcus sp.]